MDEATLTIEGWAFAQKRSARRGAIASASMQSQSKSETVGKQMIFLRAGFVQH
jgi:hypothetical protein